MGNLGIGVTISMLGGNEQSAKAVNHAIDKRITGVSLRDNRLRFALEDGATLEIYDDGQSCCEDRFMTCDDDLGGFFGAQFLSAEVRDAPSVSNDEDDHHDVQFLVIKTSKGDITAETHNKHNGYYGGFAIAAELA